MTPEQQIEQLAKLTERFEHVMRAIDDIRQEIKEQAGKQITRGDLKEFVTAKELEGLRDQIRVLQSQVEKLQSSTPRSLWLRLVEYGSGSLVFVGVWQFIEHLRK